MGRPVLAEARPDHVLFSFHGLPERQVKKSDLTGAHCLARADCCDAQVPANRWCYRMQCFFTARALAQRLGLDPAKWTVTFQSRLGRTPWIKPYTDLVIPELARGGAKRLAVFCPAFVADCLETLEEIGIRAKDQFLAHGGEALTLVPSLNAHPPWVRGIDPDAPAAARRRAADRRSLTRSLRVNPVRLPVARQKRRHSAVVG